MTVTVRSTVAVSAVSTTAQVAYAGSSVHRPIAYSKLGWGSGAITDIN